MWSESDEDIKLSLLALRTFNSLVASLLGLRPRLASLAARHTQGGTVDAPYFWTVIHFFISLFYIADFYFSFHLTYVDKKSEVVIDLDLIRKNYVGCLRFYLDIVAALPFDFVRLFTVVWWWASYVKLIKSFRLLQVMRLKRLSDNQTVVNLGR